MCRIRKQAQEMQVPLLEAMNSLMQVMMMITGGWMPSVGSAAGLVHVPTGVLLLEVRGGAAAPEASEASLVMKQLVTESREPAFKSLAVWTAVVVVVVAAVVALYYQLARMKQSPTPSKPRVPVDSWKSLQDRPAGPWTIVQICTTLWPQIRTFCSLTGHEWAL